MIRVIWLETATVFWLCGGIISLSYWMCLGLMQLRQKEKHTAAPPGPEPSVFEFEMAIEKLKRPKSLVLIKLHLNWLKRDVRQFALRSINLLILSEIRGKCLSSRRSRSLYLFIRRVLKQFVVIIEEYHFCQLYTKFYPTSCCHVKSIRRGNHQWRFRRNKSTTDHIFCIRHISEKRWE